MAVINNVKPAEAIRHNMVEENEADEHQGTYDDGESLFIPEKRATPERAPAPAATLFGGFDPQASAFTPGSSFRTSSGSTTTSIFGQSATQQTGSNATSTFTKKFGESLQPKQPEPSTTPQPSTTKFGERFGNTGPHFGSADLSAFKTDSTSSTGFTPSIGTPAQSPPGQTNTGFGVIGPKSKETTPEPVSG
jgi:hypothetical protein